jgi:hypothetical protein
MKCGQPSALITTYARHTSGFVFSLHFRHQPVDGRDRNVVLDRMARLAKLRSAPTVLSSLRPEA